MRAGAQSQNLPEPSPSNTLLACEADQGFGLLFDGTLKSFRSRYVNYEQNNDTNTDLDTNWGYCASDSAICTPGQASADIRSRVKYTDFDLRLDYRDNGDEGVFYRGLTRTADWFGTAEEYSVMDDTTVIPTNRAGALYNMFAPIPFTYQTFATGKWNSVRIVVKGDSVEHWMNNRKILGFTFWNARWKAAINAGSMKNNSDFAQSTSGCQCPIDTGYIGFQGDHPTTFSIRNLRIDTVKSTINFGPASCPNVIATLPASPAAAVDYSPEWMSGSVRLRLHHILAMRALLLRLDGTEAAQAQIENNGAMVAFSGWKNPGLYFVRVFAAGNLTSMTTKIFLP